MEDFMRKKRRNYTAEEKVSIIKQHLLEGVSISELCDKHTLQPTIYYRWQKEFFENGASAFRKDSIRTKQAHDSRISKLEEKLVQKDSVLAELMYDHVQLKKSLGEL